jgi:hypothetical protein
MPERLPEVNIYVYIGITCTPLQILPFSYALFETVFLCIVI